MGSRLFCQIQILKQPTREVERPFEDDQTSIKVEVNLKLSNKDSVHSNGKCDDKTFQDEGTYEKSSLNDLNPYLGAKSEHPYNATYRRL
jgi:hypothetical protein